MIPRVEAVTCHAVDNGGAKHWLFVELRCEDGTTGWGECYTASGREQAIASIARQLGRALVGTRVSDIRAFTRSAYLDVAMKRGSMELFSAISGIEIGMWDALGKVLETPVRDLLGGPHRDDVRVYANGWSANSTFEKESFAETVEHAVEVVERGFDAIKLDPFSGPWRPHPDRTTLQSARDLVAAVREAVGSDVDLLVEGHRRLDATSAAQFAAMLEPFDPFWLEEPTDSLDVAGLAEVRSRTTIPIVAGEARYTAADVSGLLEQRAVDILNPDVAACGGLLELLEIGAMANARGFVVAPHNYNSTTVGLAATAVAGLLMPNFLVTEYFVNFAEVGDEIAIGAPTVRGGRLKLHDAPGLGVDLNLEALHARDNESSTSHALLQFKV